MQEKAAGSGVDSIPTGKRRALGRARLVPYPAIEKHGIVGDRRTAALIASDGTLDWMCLPDFDSDIVFGALLDSAKGGHWRLGPAAITEGVQSYLDDCMVLRTEWQNDDYAAELLETMLWPEWDRPAERRDGRVLVRSLRCLRGRLRCAFDLQPRWNCGDACASIQQSPSGVTFELNRLKFRVWVSQPGLSCWESRLHGEFELGEGDESWAILELGVNDSDWTVESARRALQAARDHWTDWSSKIKSVAKDDTGVRRMAAAVHLLTYAPSGSVVAAPTCSLPERIGGRWNADYRYCWLRDASLAAGMAARLGLMDETERYLQWVTERVSLFGEPLQVLYTVRGERRARQRSLGPAFGYRGSKPVFVGNHAYKQHQLGSYGYLADCLWLYLQGGGSWRQEYWKLIRRLAEYTIKHWRRTENGMWELPVRQHYVSSKVLSWVTLDRAVRIAERVEAASEVAEWRVAAARIHDDVLERGWCERLGSFRQRYEAESLDASSLLISVFELLPGDHPRVLATIDRTIEFLSIDGFVYRFDPRETPGLANLPLGHYEGAFLPCTFWLATALAKSGRPGRARKILEKAQSIAGPVGLFAEGVDPRNCTYLGNSPLLFSHVEYVRARLEIACAEGDEAK